MTFSSVSDHQGTGESKLKHDHDSIVHANKNLSSDLSSNSNILDDTLVSQYASLDVDQRLVDYPQINIVLDSLEPHTVCFNKLTKSQF